MDYKTHFLKNWYMYSFIGILVYSLVLRVLYLGQMPMWIDETISASAAKAILEHGYPLLDSGSTYFRAWIFSYLSAPFIWIFGIDIGSRVVSVIFGVLTVYLAYLFGQRFISNKFGGLAFAALIAFSTVEIIYSKQARFYQMFQFFYFLSFYLFYRVVILKEYIFKNIWLNYLAILLSVYISINTQFMGYIIVPLLILIYGIYNYKYLLQNKLLLAVLLGVLAGVVHYAITGMQITSVYSVVLQFASWYTDHLFSRVVIIILFVLGVVYGFCKDWKFTLSFLSYFTIPFVGIIFIESFATRYIYFAFFGVFFFIAYLFSQLRFRWVILILFIGLNMTLFSFSGIAMVNYDSSMPWADWQSAYSYLDSTAEYSDLPRVVTWTPAAYLYSDADYWLKYSISGRSNETWMLSSDYKHDKYVNASVITSVNEFPSEFVLVLDSQASRKVGPTYLSYFRNNCAEQYSSIRIWVLLCES